MLYWLVGLLPPVANLAWFALHGGGLQVGCFPGAFAGVVWFCGDLNLVLFYV